MRLYVWQRVSPSLSVPAIEIEKRFVCDNAHWDDSFLVDRDEMPDGTLNETIYPFDNSTKSVGMTSAWA